ncbi:hypothetical protein Tco_0640805, partial [Tanacetum coccineum]
MENRVNCDVSEGITAGDQGDKDSEGVCVDLDQDIANGDGLDEVRTKKVTSHVV